MHDDFVHLHVHSEYSLLDGMSRLKDLAERAAELGQPAVALTDHGVMFGVIDFYQQALQAGVKPIIGIEAYLAPRSRFDRDPKLDRTASHLLLLAKDETGYQNLLKLASLAQLEGFYYNPRLDKEVLAQHAAGLICTTGCPSAEIPRLLRDGQHEKAQRALDWYRQVFGSENVFLELQDHDIPELVPVNKELLLLAQEMQTPLLATNDVHYVRAEDAAAQDVLLCIQTNSVVQDPKRMRMNGVSYYLKSRDEMQRLPLFDEHPDALSNTVSVAEMCDISLDSEGYRLPRFDVPKGHTPETYLRHLCEEGVRRRYPTITPEVRQRLDMELGVIHQMGFDTYFLIVWDLCRAALERNIWWNVRGSAAGSVVAYTLDITMLDPLSHDLIFERFLNPGRVTMPDIDLDYPDDQRDEMIRYTVEKYGRENVAQIITFGTLGAKAAIRDVGRAMALPLPEMDRLAKMIPGGPGIKLAASLEKIPELQQVYEETDYVRELIDTALNLEGVSRHASTHAAGVVITDQPLVEYTPLHRATKGDNADDGEAQIAVTQYPMEALESIGLLKVDFLGLSTLTILRRACELIEQNSGVHLNLNNIPVDDTKAFALLTSGEVTGIFQVESAGMRRVVTTMKPSKFEHIVATISLYRPGPMEYIDSYIQRMHGDEDVEYRHPSLEPILAETYGICVYQEQIIKMATDLAGYTAGDADLMRRAVGKKKKAELLKHRKTFIEGAVEHSGIEQGVAEDIFGDIEFFARYGFNKAHAADYAILTCQTAYLKAYYPVEFMTALMTSERSNTEKIGLLIAECRKMGIEVLPPSVGHSGYDFTIEEWHSPAAESNRSSAAISLWQGLTEGKAIRFGLGAVKNVGEGPIGVIMAARKGNPFQNLEDFCRQVDLRQVNRRALECMIKVGALDGFGERAQLLATIDRMMALSGQAHKDREVGQLLIFDLDALEDDENNGLDHLPDVEPAEKREILTWEKELVGTYVSSHPLQEHIAKLQEVVTAYSAQISEEMDEQHVTIAGIITSVRQIYTKKNDPMGFVLLEDLQGTIEIVVFPRIYADTKDLLKPDQLILVRGKVDSKGSEPKVLADEIRQDFEVPKVNNGPNGNGQISAGNGKAAGAVKPAPLSDGLSQAEEQEARDEEANDVTDEPSWLSGAPPPVDGTDALERVAVPPVAAGLVEKAVSTPQKTAVAARPIKQLHITVSTTNEATELQDILKRVYDTFSDYVGHDRFSIAIRCGEQRYLVEFPNSRTGYCDDLESRLSELLGHDSLSVQEGLIT